jgi:hypothetical protein
VILSTTMVEPKRKPTATCAARQWQHVVFEQMKAVVQSDRSEPSEDVRTLDWTYLVPTSGRRVLVLGCGWGLAPCSLALRASHVSVVDVDGDRLAFVQERARQIGVRNMTVRQCERLDTLPMNDEAFDLIVAGRPELPAEFTVGVTFQRFAAILLTLLGRDGTVQFSVRNTWSPSTFGSGGKSGYAQSLRQCRALLLQAGFARVEVYAPLPHYDAAPLALLPMKGTAAGKIFLRDLAGVFETVSPESRAAYGIRYPLARAVLQLLRHSGGAGLLKYGVPGFCVLASRSAAASAIA